MGDVDECLVREAAAEAERRQRRGGRRRSRLVRWTELDRALARQALARLGLLEESE